MPILIVLITAVVVFFGWNGKDGMPASEKYRQKFMKDC